MKKQEKETNLDSKILSVLPNAVILNDTIQGIQIISLPNLIYVKAWRFPTILTAPSHFFSYDFINYKLYAEKGILVSTESKTCEEIIPLKTSVSRQALKVVFAQAESNLLYIV